MSELASGPALEPESGLVLERGRDRCRNGVGTGVEQASAPVLEQGSGPV